MLLWHSRILPGWTSLNLSRDYPKTALVTLPCLRYLVLYTAPLDMFVRLEGLADNVGISTNYVDRTPAAREKRNKRSNDARKKRQAKDKDDAQGPPDRNSDFKKPKNSKVCYFHKLNFC